MHSRTRTSMPNLTAQSGSACFLVLSFHHPNVLQSILSINYSYTSFYFSVTTVLGNYIYCFLFCSGELRRPCASFLSTPCYLLSAPTFSVQKCDYTWPIYKEEVIHIFLATAEWMLSSVQTLSFFPSFSRPIERFSALYSHDDCCLVLAKLASG